MRHLLQLLLFFLFLICTTAQQVTGQDPIFDHYSIDKSYLNPALIGSDEGFMFTSILRKQWEQIPNSFLTGAFSCSSYEPNLSGGIGLTFLADKEGDGMQKTYELSGTYSHQILFSKSKRGDLFIGVRFGKIWRSIDFNRLVWSDQLDPINGNIYATSAQVPGNDHVNANNFNAGAFFRHYVTKTKT